MIVAQIGVTLRTQVSRRIFASSGPNILHDVQTPDRVAWSGEINNGCHRRISFGQITNPVSLSQQAQLYNQTLLS
jgi:hypothetical protein